jgi:hypothetical protein
VKFYARALKDRHEAWKEHLAQARPGSDSQITSEALELALHELVEDCLPTASPPDENKARSLEATHRRPTPPE